MDRALSWFATSYHTINRRLVPYIALGFCRRVHANVISLARPFLGLIVLFLIKAGFVWSAFWLYVVAGLTDWLDGRVAAIRREKLGLKDDPTLGAFMDAMNDKGFVLVIGAGILLLLHGEVWREPATWVGTAAIALTITLEACLTWTRTQDYQAAKSGRRIKLEASMSGKLKFTLQTIGFGGIVLAMPGITTWPYHAGLAALVLSLPFGYRSLMYKLQQRRSA